MSSSALPASPIPASDVDAVPPMRPAEAHALLRAGFQWFEKEFTESTDAAPALA